MCELHGHSLLESFQTDEVALATIEALLRHFKTDGVDRWLSKAPAIHPIAVKF